MSINPERLEELRTRFKLLVAAHRVRVEECGKEMTPPTYDDVYFEAVKRMNEEG